MSRSTTTFVLILGRSCGPDAGRLFCGSRLDRRAGEGAAGGDGPAFRRRSASRGHRHGAQGRDRRHGARGAGVQGCRHREAAPGGGSRGAARGRRAGAPAHGSRARGGGEAAGIRRAFGGHGAGKTLLRRSAVPPDHRVRRRLRETARRFQRGDGEAAGDDAGDRHQHAGRAVGRGGDHPGLG